MKKKKNRIGKMQINYKLNDENDEVFIHTAFNLYGLP